MALSLAGRACRPTRAPGRLRRPTWHDPRLVSGVLLIALSTTLGAWALSAAADTDEVYALTQDVAPGTDLTADGVLTLVSSHPGTGSYVLAGDLPEQAVTTRSLSAGELLPTAAVAQRTPLDLRALVLPVSTSLPAGTGVGSGVDLWLLPKTTLGAGGEAGQGSAARQVATGLVVSAVGAADTSLVGSSVTNVEVLVPSSDLATVLSAVSSEGALVLVPVGAGA